MTGRAESPSIILVGNPNVGKSLLFHQLTGTYASVSNYPGTTVEITRGKVSIRGRVAEIVDTPGMYSLFPITGEERVARNLLFSAQKPLVLHVVDAKNLCRQLPLTFQLLEGGFQVLLVVNMLDEAKKEGIHLDLKALEARLGIPVAATVLIRRQGLAALKKKILYQLEAPFPLPAPGRYSSPLEESVRLLSLHLKGLYGISPRLASLLLLSGDRELEIAVARGEGSRRREILNQAESLRSRVDPSVSFVLVMDLHRRARNLLEGVFTSPPPGKRHLLSGLMIEPVTGIPLLLLVAYVGLYRFVGGFGAGYLVDILEVQVFEGLLIPWVNRLALAHLPGRLLPQILALEYGMITMGLRYAVAIVLPIVGVFFFFFSFLEDTGYLPRLALLADRFMKGLGLSGRALIPLALGLGCGTMAVIVTRTLETRREKLIASFLLALAIPCSAQLGLFVGILSPYPPGLFLWLGVVLFCLMAAGFLADGMVPGEKAGFYLEIPPLRVPSLFNILVKTYTRMAWYFREVLPVFLIISLAVSISQYLGFLDLLVLKLSPAMALLGMPEEMALIFILGFLRRDYGAAGLHDLWARGLLDPPSLVVAAVTLTLFLPCMAQMAVLFRERGVRATLIIITLVGGIALGAGMALHQLFLLIGF